MFRDEVAEARERRGDQTGVLVVDDHPLWRDAVCGDLEAAGFLVVGAAGTGTQAVTVAAATLPDVVVCDLQLPDISGAEVTARLLDAHPWMRVLILSASGEQQDVLDAVKAGASGYLVKSASAQEVRDAVAATARGEAVFTSGLAGLVLGEFRRLAAGGDQASDVPPLTARELEVLRMVAKGLTSRQISTRLHLSPRTVENHVGSTLKKLQLHTRVELTRYALEHGLAD